MCVFHHKRVAKMSQNLLEGSQNILESSQNEVAKIFWRVGTSQFIGDKLFLSADELILYICLPRQAWFMKIPWPRALQSKKNPLQCFFLIIFRWYLMGITGIKIKKKAGHFLKMERLHYRTSIRFFEMPGNHWREKKTLGKVALWLVY